MRQLIITALLAAIMSGCAPWVNLHKVDLGMTKAEAIQQLGKPVSVTGNGKEEYLYYVPVNRFWERYYVYLVDGKVEAYGRLGGQAVESQ
ncbi:MAG: hypothetical protein JRE16_04260 [Deltaproteobacteria bacterium]|jgi:hypothetical protein|nr:hypothetical protein [Deltaproteobacteria bacterium]MBW2503767.1 hypothetical protein [Deltaproteobacteria bacterium]